MLPPSSVATRLRAVVQARKRPGCAPPLVQILERPVRQSHTARVYGRDRDYSERRKQLGRPRVMAEISELVVGMAQYHGERNHQGLGNVLIEAEECVGSPDGKVRCRKQLGGLLSYYHRAAA